MSDVFTGTPTPTRTPDVRPRLAAAAGITPTSPANPINVVRNVRDELKTRIEALPHDLLIGT